MSCNRVFPVPLAATTVNLRHPAGLSNAINRHANVEMADFRFKGYVNDFMVSPRNPVTLQTSHQMASEYASSNPIANSMKVVARQHF